MTKYLVTPIGKPRMSRADKWKQRPAVMRYRFFCDDVRLHDIRLPEAGAHVTFVLPMPQSWNKKKRALMDGKPHQKNLISTISKKPCWMPFLITMLTSGIYGKPKFGERKGRSLSGRAAHAIALDNYLQAPAQVEGSPSLPSRQLCAYGLPHPS